MKKSLKLLALTALAAVCLSTTIFGFSDVTDEDLSLSISALQSMEIVGGYSDGTYQPDNYVTRAEFAKMVVEASSESVTLATTGTTNAYSDVSSTHWASKYITLADDLGYVNGSDGTFKPEANITLGEASTVMLRVLGYTTADIGYVWPEDYTAAAKSMGLLENVSVTGDYDAMSRGNVAQIVYNMLTAENSDGTDFVTTWGASSKEDVVLVDSDVSTITYMVDGGLAYAGFVTDIPDELFGSCRGTLLFNSSGRICGFVPNDETRITVEVAEVNASEVQAANGTNYSVPSYADVIIGEVQYVYGTSYYTLDGYGAVVLCYGEDGIVDLVLPSTGGYVEGYQLHGFYEAASPNPSQPETVTILGAVLTVNDDIAKNFGSFAYGEEIVVTLDASGEIIAVKEYSENDDNQAMFGIYSASDETVKLTCGITITGEITVGSTIQDGQLVKVMPDESGEFDIYTCKVSTTMSLNVSTGKLGRYSLAENAVIYECVGNGPANKITLNSIDVATVAAKSVMYHNINSDGEVDLLLLEDVTGDCYTYGMIITANDKDDYQTTVDGYGGLAQKNVTDRCVTIVNIEGTTVNVRSATWFTSGGEMGGIVASNDGTIQGQVTLVATDELDRSAMSGTETVVANGIRYEISDDVQVLCGVTEAWTDLESAMVVASSFIAYYDKSPEEGGKIRVICTYAD